MQTERIPAYAQLVGQWTEERHLAAMADGRHAYFIARRGDAPVGFAILRDWASPEHATLLKRIVVGEAGRGDGAALLRAVMDAVFGQTAVHRLWLGVYPENVRARRAYASAGFVEEGVMRGSAFFHGAYRDEVMMSVLRPDWSRLRGATGDQR
ncbi:GNAT family N-acetyltransferase [Falsiroseomonas bella]|uniref:GNAT family N-acetyltransferase n=2 Tax=Falsiroseomonas bella TaxID=2184016 RepID=A0A317FG13_9PROT|nr:GNAT family N-acetyltransferase [Falsiroseomonas bella]